MIIILPLIVSILFDHVNSILCSLVNCFSKFKGISFKSVEKMIPRILYGSLDQGSGMCGQILSLDRILEPNHMAAHLSIFSLRPEHISKFLIILNSSDKCF